MNKKIVIIEDAHDDYYALIGLLQNYAVEFFPSKTEFSDFSDLLNDFAVLREDDIAKDIISQIAAQQPDYILLDIGLNFNEEFDQSGKELEKKLLEAGIKQSSIYYLTNKQSENDHYIEKRGRSGLEVSLFEVFLKRCKIQRLATITSNTEVSGEAASQSSIIPTTKPTTTSPVPQIKHASNGITPLPPDPLIQATAEPGLLKVTRRFTNFKLTPVVTYLSDLAITYSFYTLILFLALAGAGYLLYVAWTEHSKVLNIAETTFIVFLPFLVVSGFFIFYIQSLRPYLLGNTIIVDRDFDKASRLMMLTKKLFISSLISYLFTKLIEILYLEFPPADKAGEPATEKSAIELFQVYHGTIQPLIQVYVTCGAIVLLVLYYIYLNSHTTGHSDKPDVDHNHPYNNNKV